MNKDFIVNVPDELWVNSWESEKTETYSYNGPDNIWVLVAPNGTVNRWSEEEIVLDPDTQSGWNVVSINADENTGVAYHLVHMSEDWTYSYNVETNPDGSTYNAITNPRLHDYFELSYTGRDGLVLDPRNLYKTIESPEEEKAKKRLEYVKKYDDAYDFDDDVQASIDTFISNMNTWLNNMAPVRPWKYVKLDASTMPRIPASLVAVFNSLPELD